MLDSPSETGQHCNKEETEKNTHMSFFVFCFSVFDLCYAELEKKKKKGPKTQQTTLQEKKKKKKKKNKKKKKKKIKKKKKKKKKRRGGSTDNLCRWNKIKVYKIPAQTENSDSQNKLT